MSLLDLLQQRLGGEAVNHISGRLGADPGATRTAIGAALPLLIGALAQQAGQPERAQALAGAVTRDHDGSVLDDVPGYLNGDRPAQGQKILNHVLGDRQPAVQTGLSQVSGLDAGKTGQLLTMLAPLVMGALGHAKRDRGLDDRGLATLLTGEHERLKASSPGAMGALGRFLDRDGDGSVMDDVGGLLGKAFGK